MKRSTASALGCGFLVGAALAFPAGMMMAGGSVPERERNARLGPRHPELLNPYSPQITSDPYFIEQQRKGLEALQSNCRKTGAYCKEAGQLRQWLAARGAAP